jgi:LemA protein
VNEFFSFITGIIELIIFLAVVLAAIAPWGYNKMRLRAEEVKEAWSNINVATRKKISLVNQMIDLVRGYQESEKLVMVKISDDLTVSSIQQANQQSGTILSAINGIAQRYPDLKASGQYDRLAESIDKSEADLELTRRIYNNKAKEYNTLRSSIPHEFYCNLLGFHVAPYLSLDAVEAADAGQQKPLVSDDGERVNELLGRAGIKVVSAAKSIAEQGRLLAEKSAAGVHAGNDGHFHYLDADKRPRGPVTRADLDRLFRSGAITGETDVLTVGSENWRKYRGI